MAREVPEIDRLIEEGLTLYGQGDLDGALLQWERALAIDPDNAQANSYFDYVRANYELLTTDAGGGEQTAEGVPFGIADDEPEYQIEIQPGEIKPSMPSIAPPMQLDPVDEGWTIDEETHDSSAFSPRGVDANGQTVEMEADEPPERLPVTRPATEPPGVSFDDATREYAKRDHAPPQPSPSEHSGFGPLPGGSSEFTNEETPGFGHPNDFQTPPGFGTQTTGIKQRGDLGFVQPTAPAAAQTQPGPMIQRPPMTATQLGLPDRPRTPAPSHPPASMMDELTLDPVEPSIPEKQTKPDTRGAPVKTTPPINAAIAAADLDDMDLISSLPSPRPAPSVPQVEISTPLSGSLPPTAAPAKATTRDFPHQVTRSPAHASASTREMPPGPVVAASATQDFDAKTTERKGTYDQTSEIPNMAQAALVSAPTRDLGLRDLPPDAVPESRDGTRADVVLGFDPIDARASEIIEDVDEAAPANEAKEDQTRRRITTLFEKASQWSSEGDLERAVAAVDLALSEDPNAALAQKLIHRNRDTIMTVFQTYLGDLQRTPQLAKPLHELANAPISPRAAFLLSRIDGLLSIDEILDVCGMPRLEAYRYLCQLFLRGILR